MALYKYIIINNEITALDNFILFQYNCLIHCVLSKGK